LFKVVHPLSRQRSGLAGTLVLFLSAFALSACIVTADQSIEANPKDPRAQDLVQKIQSIDLLPRQTADTDATGLKQQNASRPAIYLSDGSTPQGAALAEREGASGNGYDLNFENAPVATVAKVILGDVMNVGYTIDPRVQGTVTLASVRPVPKADALYVLENALRMSGVALVRDGSGSYRLLPANEAGPGGIDRSPTAEAGQGISVVPLRYVSARSIFRLLDAFGVKAATMRPDNARNTLLVTGSGTDRAAAIDTILSFDADWMKGQSVGIFQVRNSSPEPVITEIEKIMDSGEGGLSQNTIKFQPIGRLNSILVVSQKPEYLKRAQVWIARLDRSDTDGVNLKAYPLRYGNAKVVVALLNDILLGQNGATSTLDNSSSQISPGSGASMSSSGPGGNPVASLSALPTAAAGASTPVTTPPGFSLSARPAPAATNTPSQDNTSGSLLGSGSKPNGNALLQNVRMTADVTNNAVLVYANQESQRVVEQTIRQIDRPQRQIAIESTIAEVTLNNQLNYGVQFFLASNKGSVANSISGISNSKAVGSNVDPASDAVNAAAGALLGRALPGFNFLIGSENAPRVVLDALHNITDVKVLSNPSLVVLDNQVATLQVGDQVPFSTGTATVLTANNSVVNTIDYKNTGIILRVLPRANANGNVVLDIEQEISSVSAASSGTLTPTISQRRVKSSIAVTSGQTVLLAGLISETENKQRQGIPVLDSIPGMGDAFSHQTNARARTELILFIRPTVIKDGVDAHVIAEEMRSKMNSRLVGTSNPVVVVPPKTAR
jgi:general secretion pathway protein D